MFGGTLSGQLARQLGLVRSTKKKEHLVSDLLSDFRLDCNKASPFSCYLDYYFYTM